MQPLSIGKIIWRQNLAVLLFLLQPIVLCPSGMVLLYETLSDAGMYQISAALLYAS